MINTNPLDFNDILQHFDIKLVLNIKKAYSKLLCENLLNASLLNFHQN